ncbi:MAG: cation-transporting P-type ATPase [Pseudomonadales bacterium]
MPTKPPESTAWHTHDTRQVLTALNTGPNGLDSAEAERRVRDYGPNSLPAAKPRSAIRRLLAQLHNLLIYVLLASAMLAIAIGHVTDALVIGAVVVINAIVGFIQEGRAEQALDAIRALIDPRVAVLRDGQRCSVAAQGLVPGDIVLLEAGDRVSADLRLIRARNLRADEAPLTGESVPVDKGTAVTAADAAIGDRTCMAFSGTLITAGQGMGVVVATGAATELGRISGMLRDVPTLTTPLLRQVSQFARQLTIVLLAASSLIFVFAVLARGYPIEAAFMVVVGLLVAAIPEGLPAVMTITLAVGVRRMAGRHAIIRRLPAVETLGAVSVICSDKTGTLTRNEMQVRSIVTASGHIDVDGVGYRPEGTFRIDGGAFDPAADPVIEELTLGALLCNDSQIRQAVDADDWLVEGDPMEGALLALAVKAGHHVAAARDRLVRLDELPFDAEQRYMATLHTRPGQPPVAYLKGAPERILSLCDRVATPDGTAALDMDDWNRKAERLAMGGQRVIAVAARSVAPGTAELTRADVESGLTLLGVLGLIDPPRPEAVAAIAECRAAGIRVKMITGDHVATARAIAEQLAISRHPDAVTGQQLDQLDDAALTERARTADVFARTSPAHKLRLVTALQSDGSVVAMTGDGVNDAPALKRADVGVAMGRRGTEAAKDASEMVLADDNFASIVAAVREGRTVYDNLTKVIAWTLPTNGGEALTIILAVLLGLTLPVTPVQILWINMVTAVALGLTLAFEPAERGTMVRAPRPPAQPLLTGRLVWRVTYVSMLMVAGAFGIYAWATARGLDTETARTLVVNTIVVMEIFYLFSVRFAHGTALTWQGVLGTRAVLAGVATVVAAQIAFTYLPLMQNLFQSRPIALGDGLVILAIGITLLVIVELEKRLAAMMSD